MILDWIDASQSYVLKVPRSEGRDLQALRDDHGLDFSVTDSTVKTAVLFTREPYAAASFGDVATPIARAKLGGILSEIEASWAPTSEAHIKVPDDQELWPFQKAGLEYALRRKHTLIGDQPGCGKTPMAVAFANEIAAKRVLVVCPASIRLQWVKKIREWTTMRWPYHVHIILNSRHGVHPHAQWTVVSYELARTEAITRALATGEYDLLVLDEAHYLKTHDARRTRAVFGGGLEVVAEPLAARSERVLALTGTPLPNRPREAYTLARGLCFDAIDWMSEDRFRFRFNPSIRGETIEGKIYVDERTGRHAELQNRLRANFMVRRLKHDVMPQLHLPRYDIIRLEETAPVKAALQAESLLGIDPDQFDENVDLFGGNIAEARHQMGVALAPQIADYIDMLIDGGEEKLLIGYHHVEVGNIFEAAWARHGVLRWHPGKTKGNEEKKLQFMRDRRFKIAMGNLLTIGTGVDGLQEVCTHALIAEADWVPGNNIQFFDRIDRGGQKGVVQGDIFVAPGSLLEKILGSSLQKLQTNHKALDRRVTA